jgi:hypothetical protein
VATRKEEIYNWLIAGIQQPPERFQELFYFDKRDKEFFSILVTDYFLFDENLNVADNFTSSYSEKDIEKIGEKLKRIENQTPEIVALPRSGVSESNQEMEYFLQQIDSFLNLNAINIEDAMIWIPGDGGSIIFKLTDNTEDKKKRAWWRFW